MKRLNLIKKIVLFVDIIFGILILAFIAGYISFNKSITKLSLVNNQLIIREAELSDGVRMYKYTDTNWKDYYIIVARTDDGTIYVASNRCRLHDGDLRGYFIVKDGVLKCEKSGNVIIAGQIGNVDGCSPIPIDFEYEDGIIKIDIDF